MGHLGNKAHIPADWCPYNTTVHKPTAPQPVFLNISSEEIPTMATPNSRLASSRPLPPVLSGNDLATPSKKTKAIRYELSQIHSHTMTRDLKGPSYVFRTTNYSLLKIHSSPAASNLNSLSQLPLRCVLWHNTACINNGAWCNKWCNVTFSMIWSWIFPTVIWNYISVYKSLPTFYGFYNILLRSINVVPFNTQNCFED